jgi:hypothetical protein
MILRACNVIKYIFFDAIMFSPSAVSTGRPVREMPAHPESAAAPALSRPDREQAVYGETGQ